MCDVFQGKYDESLEYYKRSLKMTERALGDDHPEVATTLNNIGLVLQSQVCCDVIVRLDCDCDM